MYSYIWLNFFKRCYAERQYHSYLTHLDKYSMYTRTSYFITCSLYLVFYFAQASSSNLVRGTVTQALIIYMGDFDIFIGLIVVFLLGFVIYNVINSFSFRELLKRFGYLKIARRDFYECGFRPTTQKTIRLPIQFLLICVFFLLYDIELIFLFPFSSGADFMGTRDLWLITFFFFVLYLSLIFDVNRHALEWQY